MHRALILGVPRSGKSRLAARLAAAQGMTHYPIDSLVTALGQAYPQLGIGRQFADAGCRAALAPLLRQWIPHLDYEKANYILEGYHIDLEVAAELARAGFRVAALGYRAIDPAVKCREIRSHDRPGDWTADLTDAQLLEIVSRLREESRALQSECERRRLAYFDVSDDPDAALTAALGFLSLAPGTPDDTAAHRVP